MYLWDWSEVDDEGARFENMVGGHLLKAVHYWSDTGWGRFELFYLRDREKREVDFLVTRDRQPWLILETKTSDMAISPHLRYYAERLKPAMAIQLVRSTGIHDRFDLPAPTKGYRISADALLGLF